MVIPPNNPWDFTLSTLISGVGLVFSLISLAFSLYNSSLSTKSYKLNFFKERFTIYNKFKETSRKKGKEKFYEAGSENFREKNLIEKLSENISYWKEVSSLLNDISILFKYELDEEESLSRSKNEFLKLDYYIDIYSDCINEYNFLLKNFLTLASNMRYERKKIEKEYLINNASLHGHLDNFLKALDERKNIHEEPAYKNFFSSLSSLSHELKDTFSIYVEDIKANDSDGKRYYSMISEYCHKINDSLDKKYARSIVEHIEKIMVIINDFKKIVEDKKNEKEEKYFSSISSIISDESFFERLISFMEKNLATVQFEIKSWNKLKKIIFYISIPFVYIWRWSVCMWKFFVCNVDRANRFCQKEQKPPHDDKNDCSKKDENKVDNCKEESIEPVKKNLLAYAKEKIGGPIGDDNKYRELYNFTDRFFKPVSWVGYTGVLFFICKKIGNDSIFSIIEIVLLLMLLSFGIILIALHYLYIFERLLRRFLEKILSREDGKEYDKLFRSLKPVLFVVMSFIICLFSLKLLPDILNKSIIFLSNK